MWYDPGDDDWSASSLLVAFVDSLYSDYLEYWELDGVRGDSRYTEWERAHFRSLKELAESLTPCLHSLSMSTEALAKVRGWLEHFGAGAVAAELTADTLVAMTKGINRHAIIRDRIQLDLALQACDTLLGYAEDRAHTLFALIGTWTLSERAAAFLDRATRLYLWGFDPESVVMCASVLEAAYEQRFTPADMFRLQIQKKGLEFGPYEYEQAALADKVFDPADRTLATTIRRARNDTLHNAPNVALAADEALRGTATLLTKLFPV